MSVSIVP
jgi:Glu-tRNA(Gln) amidotransferase subunit E-like FAD-binding protein